MPQGIDCNCVQLPPFLHLKDQVSNYSDKLKDPRWQRKRLEIMQRDKFSCCMCGDGNKTLNVHHRVYSNNPWEADPDNLITLGEDCHERLEECLRQLRIGIGSGEALRCVEVFIDLARKNGAAQIGNLLRALFEGDWEGEK